MFCKKCGAQIPDGSTFCTVCGLPVSEPQQAQNQYQPQNQYQAQNHYQPQNQYQAQAQYQPQNIPEQQNPYEQQPQAFDMNGQPVQYMQPQAVKAPMSPEKKKKLILFGGIGAGVLVIVIAFIIILSSCGKNSNSSCASVIDTYINSAMSGNVDEYLSTVPPDVITYNVKNNYYDDYSAYKESIQSSISISSLLSSSVQVRYEIIDERHCADSESLVKVTKKYCERYDASSQITDVAKCKVTTYTTYGNIGTPSTDTNTIRLIKVGGGWYVDGDGISSFISDSKFK